jgi:hypothetical protein
MNDIAAAISNKMIDSSLFLKDLIDYIGNLTTRFGYEELCRLYDTPDSFVINAFTMLSVITLNDSVELFDLVLSLDRSNIFGKELILG